MYKDKHSCVEMYTVYGQNTFTLYLGRVIIEWAVKETVMSLAIAPKVCLDSEAIADLLVIDMIQHVCRNRKDNQFQSLELLCRIS